MGTYPGRDGFHSFRCASLFPLNCSGAGPREHGAKYFFCCCLDFLESEHHSRPRHLGLCLFFCKRAIYPAVASSFTCPLAASQGLLIFVWFSFLLFCIEHLRITPHSFLSASDSVHLISLSPPGRRSDILLFFIAPNCHPSRIGSVTTTNRRCSFVKAACSRRATERPCLPTRKRP